jgi:hypothetical protein
MTAGPFRRAFTPAGPGANHHSGGGPAETLPVLSGLHTLFVPAARR